MTLKKTKNEVVTDSPTGLDWAGGTPHAARRTLYTAAEGYSSRATIHHDMGYRLQGTTSREVVVRGDTPATTCRAARSRKLSLYIALKRAFDKINIGPAPGFQFRPAREEGLRPSYQ